MNKYINQIGNASFFVFEGVIVFFVCHVFVVLFNKFLQVFV